jgi:hypothetical protein
MILAVFWHGSSLFINDEICSAKYPSLKNIFDNTVPTLPPRPFPLSIRTTANVRNLGVECRAKYDLASVGLVAHDRKVFVDPLSDGGVIIVLIAVVRAVVVGPELGAQPDVCVGCVPVPAPRSIASTMPIRLR